MTSFVYEHGSVGHTPGFLRNSLCCLPHLRRSSTVLGSILELIELHSQMIEPVRFPRAVCSDPDDDKFLEAALAAKADYVVSGDAVLLRLRIVRPAQFLKLPSQ